MTNKYNTYSFNLGNDELVCFALNTDLNVHMYSLTQAYLTIDPTYNPKQAAKRCIEIVNTTMGVSLLPQGFDSIETYKYEGRSYKLIMEEQVSKLWIVCASLGRYPKAYLLLAACAEEALNRRANRAIGIQVTEDEYNERMKARVEGKESRLTFTDAIKSYIERNSITGNEAKFMYKNATDKLYSCLTGYSSTKKFREKENIPLKQSPRDYASAIDLMNADDIESAAARWIYHKNIHPYDAVEYCTNQLLLSKVGWNKQTRL